jgi:hypothetical protein
MVFQLFLIVGFHFIVIANETDGNSPGYGRAFEIKWIMRLKGFNRKKKMSFTGA